MTPPGNTLSPKLLARLRSRRPDVREAAERELLELGPRAVEMLLRTLEAERPKRVRNRRIAYALIAIFALATIGSLVTPGGHTTINFGQFWVVFALLAATSIQRNAAQALTRFSDKRAIGALAEALDYHDKEVRQAAAQALTRILPAVNASDHALLSYDERRALDRAIVKPGNTELAVAVLRAYEQIGDAESLTLVERIAEGKVNPIRHELKPILNGLSVGVLASVSRVPLDPAVIGEAKAILPAMRVRAELVQAAQTLLRPAQAAPDEMTLLRPAEPSAPRENTLLVRPVGADDADVETSIATAPASVAGKGSADVNEVGSAPTAARQEPRPPDDAQTIAQTP